MSISSQSILAEFQDLAPREKLLTFAALIAFPVDIVALLTLLFQVIRFQQNDTPNRPSAINIGLPSFVWDTRIADVITLSALIYSLIILLLFSYRQNTKFITKTKLREYSNIAGDLKEYQDILKYNPRTPDYRNIEHGSHILAWFYACIYIIPLFLFFLLIWSRIFLIHTIIPFFTIITSLLGILLFTRIFLSNNKTPYSKRYFNKIPKHPKYSIYAFFDYNYEFDNVTLDRPLGSLYIDKLENGIANNFISDTLYAILKNDSRFLRTIIRTSIYIIPFLLIIFKLEFNTELKITIFFSFIIAMLVIPIIWVLFLIMCYFIGQWLTFLFPPLTTRQKIRR